MLYDLSVSATDGTSPGSDGVPEPVYAADVTGAIAKARRRRRNQLLAAVLVSGLTVGASTMSCIGQSFSLRQARALEAIQHALEQRCATPIAPEASR